MDIIFINKLSIETFIGVHDYEKATKQTLIIDLKLWCDLSQASASDNIKHTIDYALVNKLVQEFCSEKTYQLIEALALAIISMLETKMPSLHKIKIKITKPKAIVGVNVGVIIQRDVNKTTQ